MENLPANLVDILVVLALLVSGILAYWRGLVHETLSIGGWLGAILATIYGFPLAQPHFRQLIPNQLFADIAAGLAIFLVTLFVLSVLTHAISGRIKDSALGALDRALGFLFGLARGAVLVCLVYLGALWVWPEPKDQPEWMTAARSAPLMHTGGRLLQTMVPDKVVPSKQQVDRFTRETEKLLDQQQTLKDMLDVKPKTPEQRNGTDSGYDAGERRDMDRLIEGSQQ